MVAVPLRNEVRHYTLDGCEAVEEIIKRTWIGFEFGQHEVVRYEHYYKQIQFPNLEAALAAQRRDYDEARRETYRNETVEIEHPHEHQSSIIQVSEYRITLVRGEERHRQLLNEHFRFHRKRYDTFALAIQARQASIQKSELHNKVNGYAIESIFYHQGQQAIRSAKKALDTLRQLIDQSSGSEQTAYKQQRAEINRHYLAELLIEKANQKMATFNTKSVGEKIQILQEVKDLYAKAMAHESIKQDFYRTERAKLSVLKTNLEKESQENIRESQLHREAKSLARIARDNQQISDYDAALRKYAELIEGNPVNIADYKHERAALYQEKLDLQNGALAQAKAMQDAREKIAFEQDILAKFAAVEALIATTDDLSGQALIDCYQTILDKLAEIIERSPPKMDDYKSIRAQINRQKMDCEQGVGAANVIIERANPIRRNLGTLFADRDRGQVQQPIPAQQDEHVELQFNH